MLLFGKGFTLRNIPSQFKCSSVFSLDSPIATHVKGFLWGVTVLLMSVNVFTDMPVLPVSVNVFRWTAIGAPHMVIRGPIRDPPHLGFIGAWV